MTVTVQSFRLLFPQFADTATYSDPLLSFWISNAKQFVNEERWQALTDYGVGLVSAHFLTMLARDIKAAAFGAAPGEASGPISSKQVDKVSVSYDTQATALKDGGNWNATSYGQQYLTQARLIGAGPVQVGQGADELTAVSAFSTGGAWPGPLQGW